MTSFERQLTPLLADSVPALWASFGLQTVTTLARVWRKVPESDAGSVGFRHPVRHSVQACYWEFSARMRAYRSMLAHSLAFINADAHGFVVNGLLTLHGVHREGHTPSIAFRHNPPNSARTGHATEGALSVC